jgi:hypothetical protein
VLVLVLWLVVDLRVGVDCSSRDEDTASRSDVALRAQSPSEIVEHFYLGSRR